MNEISTQRVYQCILILSSPSNQQLIPQADAYLCQCEKDPNYLVMLMTIFEQAPTPLIKEYAFVIFARMVKNNWTTRGNKNKVDINSIKPMIKEKMIKYVAQPLKSHPFPSFKKLIDDLVTKIAHTDYPSNWQEFHSLTLQTLQNILNNPTEDNIQILKIFKNVWKHRMGKCMQKKQQFQNYIVSVIKVTFELSSNIAQSFTEQNPSKTMLTISKYVDSILLMCLFTMDKSMQDDTNIGNIIIVMLGKVDSLYKLSQQKNSKDSLIEKNIQVILQYVSLFQAGYPFVFRIFLPSYFQFILTFLTKIKQFKEKSIAKMIIAAFTHIVKCIVYYYPVQQFKASIFFTDLKHLQPQCHQHYTTFFKKQTIVVIFKQIVFETLSIEPYNVKDSVDEQQSDCKVSEQSLYLLCCGLMKQLMKRFRPVCLEIINELLTMFQKADEQIQSNIITVLLVAPKIYEKQQIPVNTIFELLQYLSSKASMHKQFALISNRYSLLIVDLAGQQILDVLINIVVTSTDIDVIFEAALAIKKMLVKQVVLNLSNLHLIVIKILSLLYKTDDPTLRWYMVNLVGKIIGQVEFQSEFVEKCINLQELETLCREPADETLVYPACDMLIKFLSKSSNNKLIALVLLQIKSKIDGNLQNPEILYNLWIEAMKKFQPSTQFNTAAVQLFKDYSSEVEELFPCLYCDLVILYLVNNLLDPGPQEIVALVLKGTTNPAYSCNQDVKGAFYQVFLIFNQIHPNLAFNRQIMENLFTQLQQLICFGRNISTNIYRSILVTVVNLFIYRNLQVFSKHAAQIKQDWLNIWLQNNKLICQVYSQKLNAVALILTLNHLPVGLISENFNSIIRCCVFHLMPESVSPNDKIVISLEIRKQILSADLKQVFRQKLVQLMKNKQISQEWVMKNLQKAVCGKLKEVLGN